MDVDPVVIAREMKSAQDAGQQLQPFTARFPAFDNDVAYDVSHHIHNARIQEGAVAVGRKIGFTNPDMWAVYDVREPIWAYVYDRTVVSLRDSRGRCRLGGFVEPRIEPEIVVHFRTAPAAGDDPLEILACIDWFAHGIEIVQSHFPDWTFRAADTIADSALHGTLLLGEPQAVAKLGPTLVADQAHFRVSLSCNGGLREQGKGSNVLGSPLAAVAHLVALLARQPHAEPLQAGELVTTGTLTKALPVQPGETWTTVLEGIALPGISVTFEA